MSAPEFSRIERLDRIGEAARTVEIMADPAECAALARRFGLIAVEGLAARFAVRRAGTTVFASGTVEARVVQACVATGDPVPASIDMPVALRFVPDTAPSAADEIEIDADALDSIGYAGGAIDLGEAAAETMALALDPFPRSAGADAALKAAGVLSEEEAALAASPFAALGALAGKPGDAL
ncbi:DUF177 domain-containing protein [Sphingomonas sp.]|uniref:YceD family protein n=1 Tax=Sphingomonas sp. TaxID=28214 RepID=UPI001D8696DE|nr:DUF177 domain-containing protein [Sphingomonas sp.]MBX9795554.1 DUF177 domain-containing protein [Sphingomonas sp.]